MNDVMYGPMAGLGLKHVLEDGLAMLRGHNHSQERQGFVIRDLTVLLRQAERGVAMAESQGLFMDSGAISAFEAYSLFFRYLNDAYQDQLSSRISSTSSTLERLANKEAVDRPAQEQAKEFIERLLLELSRNDIYQQQQEPEFIGLR